MKVFFFWIIFTLTFWGDHQIRGVTKVRVPFLNYSRKLNFYSNCFGRSLETLSRTLLKHEKTIKKIQIYDFMEHNDVYK